jgi:uncharacterized LabA/DUF88 family protein
VSKNVAVFVDVANIFYAAKAAGIDIDYVTLLKSATAGRDFVRAYAYTGLDPENENQRQFHSFLARNGYKVISKDIRKYGDGRIKANLDIELVVDMMKTARNLDIAVVVSGDGDFAPAIRAVQEQGVRVEVISFRGNTSSDLIEVADLFTDIAQIARVDKSSARSGRRVAAEGDLSMTEVPEKETEGAPRRRRGGRGRDDDRRPEVAAAAAPAAPAAAGRGQGNLIVLPGERLSRGAAEGDELDMGETAELTGEAGAEFAAQSENGSEAALGEAGRRRRRRGGRGRGRGRRPDGETFVGGDGGEGGEAAEVAAGSEEDDDFEDVQPPQISHQAFGSVWDSQIGVPTSLTGSSGATGTASLTPGVNGDFAEDEDLDEPEIPEYLLAERRQRGGQRPGPGNRGGGGRMQRGGNRSAYQAALDRERFGSGARQPSGFGANSGGSGGGGMGSGSGMGGGGMSSRPHRGNQSGGRDRNRGGRPQQSRPLDRAPRYDARPVSSEPRSSEPWSEVPADIEEMLRAEMARKSAPSEPRTAAPTSFSQEPIADQPELFAAPGDEPVAEAPAKPVRRARAPRSAATTAAPVAEAAAETAPEAPTEEPAAAPKRRTSTRSTAATTAKPTTTRSRTSSSKASAAPDAAEAAPEVAAEAAEAAPAAKPATRRRKTASPAAEEG